MRITRFGLSTSIVSLTVVAFAVGLAVSVGAAPATQGPEHVMAADASPDVVAQVRQATEQFRDVAQAINAQYGAFLGCVSGPQEGAMGIHFVNMNLVGDGELDINHPEALIYEPTTAGLRLVGVEYLVTVDDWRSKHPNDGLAAPVLAGQVLQFNDSPNRFGLPPFYELHVWAWQDNPNGTFVDWNKLVKCDGR